jgi:hypothetical protein
MLNIDGLCGQTKRCKVCRRFYGFARAQAVKSPYFSGIITGRVERRRDRFRPMASSVSALSSIVANGHQILPTFPPPPLIIPYGGFSPVECGAPHFMRYVAKEKMWRRGPERLHSLGFPDFRRHILVGSYKVLRKPIKPFRGEGPLCSSRSEASRRAKALAFIFRSLSA